MKTIAVYYHGLEKLYTKLALNIAMDGIDATFKHSAILLLTKQI